MNHRLFNTLFCFFVVTTMTITTSCGTEDFVQNDDSKDPTSEKSDSTSVGKDSVNIDYYDAIPAEHSIEYSILSQTSYTGLGFYNLCLSRAQSVMSSMSNTSEQASSSNLNIDLRKVVKEVLSAFASRSDILIGNYNVVKIKYTTVGVGNSPIEASALILWHNNADINKVIYANHFTRLGDYGSPSDGFALEVLFAATGALVILPDYIGAGVASDMNEPYLVAQLSGDVVVDSYLAGIKFAKENISNFSTDFSGYITGYSQGGQVSLAALRSLQQRSTERQAMLNVKRVICGDGPYDLEATFYDYMKQDTMLLPVIMPIAINGIMTGYPEQSKNINYESCFTDYAIETGVPQAIRNNTATTEQLMNFPSNVPASKILASDVMDETSAVYSQLVSLLKRQSLCTGWKPQYPLLFIHDKGDTVVPYINMENAIEGLKNEYVQDPVILDEGMDHGGGMIYLLTNIINGELLK